MSDINKYLDEGFILKNKLLDQHTCKEIINYIDNKKSAVNIPFSDVGWGYGNLIDDERMEKIKNHDFILEFCTSLLGGNFVFNHLFGIKFCEKLYIFIKSIDKIIKNFKML